MTEVRARPAGFRTRPILHCPIDDHSCQHPAVERCSEPADSKSGGSIELRQRWHLPASDHEPKMGTTIRQVSLAVHREPKPAVVTNQLRPTRIEERRALRAAGES